MSVIELETYRSRASSERSNSIISAPCLDHDDDERSYIFRDLPCIDMKVVSMAQREKSKRLRQDLGSASDSFLNAANPSMSETDLGRKKEGKSRCQSLELRTHAGKKPIPCRKKVSTTNEACFRLAGIVQSRDDYAVIRQYR